MWDFWYLFVALSHSVKRNLQTHWEIGMTFTWHDGSALLPHLRIEFFIVRPPFLSSFVFLPVLPTLESEGDRMRLRSEIEVGDWEWKLRLENEAGGWGRDWGQRKSETEVGDWGRRLRTLYQIEGRVGNTVILQFHACSSLIGELKRVAKTWPQG